MPRVARKNLSSPYVHIIVQGINKEYIFNSDMLKNKYKSILKRNLKDVNASILSYCIMNNHAHILIYSESIDEITLLMKKSNTSYAKFYNKINNRVGYVFRDRYYTQTILNEKHLFNCIAYIHNNPVMAGIVSNIFEYKYSSYLEFIYKKELITNKSIKLIFGNDKYYIEDFQQIHKNYVSEDIMDIDNNEKEDFKLILNRYLDNYEMEKIIKDDIIFRNVLIELREKSKLSLREMSKIFGINKDKLNKIINGK